MGNGSTQTTVKGVTYMEQPIGKPPGDGATTLTTAKADLLEAFEQFVDVMTKGYQSSDGGPSLEEPGDAGSSGSGAAASAYGSGTSTGGTGTTGKMGTTTYGTGSHESTATTGKLQPTGTGKGKVSTKSTSYGTASTSTGSKPYGGTSVTKSSSGLAKEAGEEKSKMLVGLREAYRQDLARESTRMPRRLEMASKVQRVTLNGALQNKHTRDANSAPVREEREFPPAFGKAGRPRSATQEVIAVRIPPSARPETAPESVQAGVKLDAYWASYHTPLERAQERMRLVNEAMSEAIIGTDERTRVTNTQDYPFRCICSLIITANTGNQYIGTGWLVAPRLLLTAGHCVYMADENGWPSQIEVIPGRDESNYPYGSVIATDLRSVTGWTVDGDRDYDYGAILLPDTRRLGDELGWFGYTVRPDNYFPGIDLNLAGYPGDGGPAGIDGTQWQDHRQVKQVNARQITYEIDTYGGQSGAPVWETTTDGSRYGVAIHTWGTSTSNGATRITSDVFDNILAWAGEVA